MKSALTHPSERGEGNLGNIVRLVIFTLLLVAVYQAYPAYMQNWRFQDRLVEVARSQAPNADGDKRALEIVAQTIEEMGLSPYLTAEACTVQSGGGLGGTRTIKCTYVRPIKLFGQERKTTFTPSASSPML